MAFLAMTSCTYAQTDPWQPVASGTNKQLLSISFGSTQYGYISGKDSLLLRTSDGGLSWQVQPHTGIAYTGNARDLVDVNFLTPAIGYVIVGNHAAPDYTGTMYQTTDSGQSWTVVAGSSLAASRSFFLSSQQGFQIGSSFFSGHSVQKLDAGLWGNPSSFTSNASDFLYAIDFLDSNTGIVGGTGGWVYRTNDGGQTWDTIKANTDSTIYALKYINANTIIGAAADGMSGIIVSTDGGSTWTADMNTLTFFYPRMHSLVRSKRDSIIAVGHSDLGSFRGVVLWFQTVANGSSTMLVPGVMGVGQALHDVAMRDDSIAYAVGDSGLIMTNNLPPSLSMHSVNSSSNSVHLFPNPGHGRFETWSNQAHSIRVYDATGRCILKEERMDKSHKVENLALPRGLYQVEISTRNEAPVWYQWASDGNW